MVPVATAGTIAPVSGRVWGGLTGAQRAERRREQLLEAGLEVFATKGWARATVSDVWRAAGLSPRYFYEAFESREALFTAVVERIADDVTTLAIRAVESEHGAPRDRARAVLAAVAAYARDDPRTVRVALVESYATEEFRTQRAALLARFSDLAARLMRALNPDANPALLAADARFLSGGLAELLTSGEPVEPQRLERLFSAAAAQR